MTKVIEEILRDTFWNINPRRARGLLSSANPKNKVQSYSAPLHTRAKNQLPLPNTSPR